MPGFENLNGGGANLEDEKNLERQERDERALGARILAQIGFENRQKEIVDSSLRKERERGEKIPGKNGQRRNFAYLNRLENAIEKYGNKFEQKLWEASTEKILTKPEDIPEAYWKSQEQILRDNGQGRELSGYEKVILADDIRRQQRESLKEWANYLGDEQVSYPMWFKVYAWDGMSKMGVFDKNEGEYKRRDKGTVAPYPHLNQAALGKVYGALDDFYHRNTSGEDEAERDKVLDALVQSGNFNKLYSKFLLEQKVIPKTPERTEDVHGEWVEYFPGDEEKLAVAAEGTPWCVASPVVGRNYLETGEYGTDEDWHDDEVESKAEFILFHLKDPETGELADNACASIRLDIDGNVAEISGLNDGQALEDSLVPIVEEKVKTLPGGEHFLKAFADKKKLIELDKKMQVGEELSDDDIVFLSGDINVLDTYNDRDPRIIELLQYTSLTVDSARLKKILNEYPYLETLKAVIDDQEITRLFKKIQDGEKLSDEELKFVFSDFRMAAMVYESMDDDGLERLLKQDPNSKELKAIFNERKLHDLRKKIESGGTLTPDEVEFISETPETFEEKYDDYKGVDFVFRDRYAEKDLFELRKYILENGLGKSPDLIREQYRYIWSEYSMWLSEAASDVEAVELLVEHGGGTLGDAASYYVEEKTWWDTVEEKEAAIKDLLERIKTTSDEDALDAHLQK